MRELAGRVEESDRSGQYAEQLSTAHSAYCCSCRSVTLPVQQSNQGEVQHALMKAALTTTLP